MIDITGRRVISDISGINHRFDITDTTASLLGCIGYISCIKYLFCISRIDYYPAHSLYRLRGIYALPA
jgi:hypothetical protein